jgi:heme oxygenase
VSDVLTALRATTADRHRAVDRSMPLSRPDPKFTDYVEHLYIVRSWLGPLEIWLDTSTQLASSSPRLHQTTLIDADLADAGMPSVRAQSPGVARNWPAHASASFQWGARYVIEGSRLGTAALYRRLAHALRPHELRYLKGGNTPSPNRWPKFLHELRNSVQTPTEISEACRGACASFDALVAICPKEKLS